MFRKIVSLVLNLALVLLAVMCAEKIAAQIRVHYIRDNDMDQLIAYHANGLKFTEFKAGEKRTGPEEKKSSKEIFWAHSPKWKNGNGTISFGGYDFQNLLFQIFLQFQILFDLYGILNILPL